MTAHVDIIDSTNPQSLDPTDNITSSNTDDNGNDAPLALPSKAYWNEKDTLQSDFTTNFLAAHEQQTKDNQKINDEMDKKFGGLDDDLGGLDDDDDDEEKKIAEFILLSVGNPKNPKHCILKTVEYKLSIEDRICLSNISPVFDAMFARWKKGNNIANQTVLLPEMHPIIFQCILKYSQNDRNFLSNTIFKYNDKLQQRFKDLKQKQALEKELNKQFNFDFEYSYQTAPIVSLNALMDVCNEYLIGSIMFDICGITHEKSLMTLVKYEEIFFRLKQTMRRDTLSKQLKFSHYYKKKNNKKYKQTSSEEKSNDDDDDDDDESKNSDNNNDEEIESNIRDIESMYENHIVEIARKLKNAKVVLSNFNSSGITRIQYGLPYLIYHNLIKKEALIRIFYYFNRLSIFNVDNIFFNGILKYVLKETDETQTLWQYPYTAHCNFNNVYKFIDSNEKAQKLFSQFDSCFDFGDDKTCMDNTFVDPQVMKIMMRCGMNLANAFDSGTKK